MQITISMHVGFAKINAVAVATSIYSKQAVLNVVVALQYDK